MKKNCKKMQNGGQVDDWLSIYGSWFQNQNGQINNQMQPNMEGVLPEAQVYAQGSPQKPPMGYQQPQPLPINNQVQAQPYQQAPAPTDYSYPQQEQPQSNGMSTGQAAGGIAQGAYAIGDIFDTLGSIKKDLIKGGAGILNALIPDNQNKRQRAIQLADNQNRYGSGYQVLYENGGTLSADKAKEILRDGTANGKKLTAKQKKYFGWIAGGGKAKNGITVQEYGIGEEVPNLTPAQAAVLNQFIPYPAEQQPIPIQPRYQPEYYSALPNGEFQVNIPRHLQDRLSQSGRIGADYDQTLSRAYGYEGSYGNKDYVPTMKDGGEISKVKAFYNEYLNSPNYKQRLIKQEYLDPDRTIKDRLQMLNSAKVTTGNNGSNHNRKNNTIEIDNTDLKKWSIDKETLMAHEFSHPAGAEEYSPNYFLNLNASDKVAINTRNKLYENRFDYKVGSDEYHDAKASEFKADLDALRYNLKKDKIFDTGKQQFNKGYLKMAKEQYKNNGEVQRLLKNVKSDEDLIWLMNNIAMNNSTNPQPIYAKNGAMVTESSMYEVGQELNLTKKQIEALRAQGYEFE